MNRNQKVDEAKTVIFDDKQNQAHQNMRMTYHSPIKNLISLRFKHKAL